MARRLYVPAFDVWPVPAARARDAARDLRESLADLVATFGKGGQA